MFYTFLPSPPGPHSNPSFPLPPLFPRSSSPFTSYDNPITLNAGLKHPREHTRWTSGQHPHRDPQSSMSHLLWTKIPHVLNFTAAPELAPAKRYSETPSFTKYEWEKFTDYFKWDFYRPYHIGLLCPMNLVWQLYILCLYLEVRGYRPGDIALWVTLVLRGLGRAHKGLAPAAHSRARPLTADTGKDDGERVTLLHCWWGL